MNVLSNCLRNVAFNSAVTQYFDGVKT